MKIYLNAQYKCVKVEDNTFVANSTSNFVRYYFVTNANGDVIDKMDDTSVIYRNTEPSYVTVAFRRADGDVIQHLMASPKTDATGKSFFEYEITNTDGVLYKKGALEISAQFIEATLSETGGVKKVISQKVKAIAINTAHVLDNIGEEAEEYYSQYEQANNDAHAILQAQITTNFNNIGTLQDLTTDAKDDLIKAINEVDAHADANKSEIGDLSTLTTDEKCTIVGAINEVDQHADTAQQTAETAQTTADNATTLANNAVGKAEQAVATANEAKTTAQTAETNANNAVDTANAANATAGEAKAIAQGSQRAIGFATLQAAITALNGYSNTQLKVGDNVYIVETGVPDLWVAAVEPNSVAYNYTTNDAFNDDLVENTLVQVGYYKFAYLESDGKPCTVAWQNMVVAESDWVASTEFEDFAYEAKIILTDFVNFSSIPQVVFGLTEATSGNYAPICKAGDKGVYIYSKVNTAITLPTIVTFAPNVHGASMQGGGYTNKGKWVASTTYAIDDLVYTDNGQYVCIEGITSTTSPEQDTQHWQATFVATGKTKNTLTISGQDNGTEVQKTFDGSTPVEVAFDETTMTAKEVNGVLKVGAKGTVPEALPATGAKITGKLPTSGWAPLTNYLFNGSKTISASSFTLVVSGLTFPEPLPTSGWKINIDETGYTDKDISGTYSSSNSTDEYIYLTFSWGNTTSGGKAYLKIYYNGSIYAMGDNYFTLVRVWNTNIGVQGYTISDTAIKANSTVTMYLNSADEVRAYSKTDGSVVVEMDAVPTTAIPYTLQVVETSAEGAFEIVNSYVPTIPETPTALPQEASALTSGSLPTTGWGQVASSFWEGELHIGTSLTEIAPAGTVPESLRQDTTSSNWNVKKVDGNWGNPYSTVSIDGANLKIPYAYNQDMYVYPDGSIYAQSVDKARRYWGIKNITYGKQTFTISDTSITANSDILMELTDDGGVKAYSMEAGNMTVIRDTVPTQPIPYTYKVKQTNASGQFTVINHFVPNVPVTSVNGQTGAVTIAVPTKTSQLTNDSGFITAADIGNALYPVGSIYMSVNNTNPSTFFGGTWEAWGAGKVPVGVDANDTDFATVEKTGGEKTHTLTESEMPRHSHGLPIFSSNPEKENITFADTAFNADKASEGSVGNGGQVISTGGGQAHNNLQPYITCYMWKRTA